MNEYVEGDGWKGEGGGGTQGRGRGVSSKFKTCKQLNEHFSNTVTGQFKHTNSSNEHFSNTVMGQFKHAECWLSALFEIFFHMLL